MKKMKKTAVLLATMILTIGILAACGSNNEKPADGSGNASAASDKVYEITVNTTQAPMASTAVALQEACDAMEKASNGRLKFQIEYGGNLLGIMECWTGVADGRADISFCPSNIASDYLSITSNLFCVPFIGFENAQEAYDIYNQLRGEFSDIDAEYEAYGVKNLGVFFNGPDQIFMNKKGVSFSGMEDIKGMKLGTSEAFIVQYVNQNGGAAVFTSSADLYTNLDSGLIEGMCTHALLMQVTKCDDLIKSVVEFGDEGMMRGCSLMIMNKNTYDALPEDLQKIIDEGFAAYCQNGQKIQNNDVSAYMAKLKDNGCEIISLTEEQIAPMRELAVPITEATVSTVDSKGYQGTAIYNRIKDLIK
ncbi:MAG: TRAP transporter substrate-binding protein DctP [Lachnospiraceae bacterium]|nr:TRAP transporter substrate-binding protein DctP [Lachnospiraceae bacterium]